MTIIVKDLEFNIELDKKAMVSLLGGKRNQSGFNSYSNLAAPGKIRWANTGKSNTPLKLLSRSRTTVYKY